MTRVHVMDAQEGAEPKIILSGSGKPEYLTNCDWIGAARLSCNIFSTQRYATMSIVPAMPWRSMRQAGT